MHRCLENRVRLVREGARRVRLLQKSRFGTGTTRNVIGELVGTEQPEEIIVVGAHYDSVPGVEGARDNAAGSAVEREGGILHPRRQPLGLESFQSGDRKRGRDGFFVDSVPVFIFREDD